MKQRRRESDHRVLPDNPRLTDLIPLEKLQRIQDAFALANQVASTIIDTDGVPITRASNHSKICTMIRATPKGMERDCISKELRYYPMISCTFRTRSLAAKGF